MFIKIGENTILSLLVEDDYGNRIYNDTPSLIIKDANNNYWNGVFWQPLEFQILMTHLDNGLYTYNFIPDIKGALTTIASSSTYNKTKTTTLEVYDDSAPKYDFLINTPFLIKYTKQSNDKDIFVTINRELDNTYFDGSSWIIDFINLKMSILAENIYTYNFIPEVSGNHIITIRDGDYSTMIIVNANEFADNIPPVIVNEKTLVSLDGSDCTILDEKHMPVRGVVITAYSLPSKEILGKTISDLNGGFNMCLKPGLYFFTFDKDTYISTGFERMVN